MSVEFKAVVTQKMSEVKQPNNMGLKVKTLVSGGVSPVHQDLQMCSQAQGLVGFWFCFCRVEHQTD